MFKVNNKNTRTTSCFFVDFEQVTVSTVVLSLKIYEDIWKGLHNIFWNTEKDWTYLLFPRKHFYQSLGKNEFVSCNSVFDHNIYECFLYHFQFQLQPVSKTVLSLLILSQCSTYGKTRWMAFTSKMCEKHLWKSYILRKDVGHRPALNNWKISYFGFASSPWTHDVIERT